MQHLFRSRTLSPRRPAALGAVVLPALLASVALGCGMVQVRGLPGTRSGGAAPGRGAPAEGEQADPSTSAAPAVDAARYAKCSEAFEKDYDAWLPADAEAKAAIAKARGQSPYVAIPALVRAYAQVEEKRAVRQDGRLPAGASFATATKLEIAKELMRIGVENRTEACVDNQFSYEPLGGEFRPPLTGDRQKDKVESCGIDDRARMQAREDGRRAMAEEGRKLTNAYRSPMPVGGLFGKVRSIESRNDELVLKVDELASDYTCVPNGRYGMTGGTWGPLCDYVDLPPKVLETRTFHFAPQKLPVDLKGADGVNMAYELDPNAPASSKAVPKSKGKLWINSVERSRKEIYSLCGRSQIWSLHHPMRRF